MSENQQQSGLITRPPIVVVLGHVDHGKTSILDKIRQTRIADKESGGITQHIGAYQAEITGRKITFLDTPGHEAFSAIRSRGAKVADVGILVVAAEEGLKPQTKEAIQIIKQAALPFVVAINKIDKDSANPQRVRQELAEAEVMVEDYGGQVPVVEISAKTGQGIDHLLEIILLLADMEELKYQPETPAKGIVIESRLESRKGLVATLIPLDGKIEIGDWLAAGVAVCKVKSMEDFLGKPIKSVIASQPCVITGWEIAPKVGQEFLVVNSKEEAEKLALESATLSPVNLFVQEVGAVESVKRIANLVVKADVQSSLEAIDQILRTIKSEEVDYKVVGFGVGNISDADIKNARASNAMIVGFHVDVDGSAKNSAERENIKVQTFEIIYELVEGVKSLMSDLLDPEIKRNDFGKLKVLAIFKGGDNKSQIIGGKITTGKAVRGALLEVYRGGALLMNGKIGQLQQNKADVSEISEGHECGIRFDSPTKMPSPIAVGDTLEIYQEEKIKRSI